MGEKIMSRGNKGGTGCPLIFPTKRRLPKWLKQSYAERVIARDAASARRRAKLEAKGKVKTLGIAVLVHVCGQATRLEKDESGSYASFCPTCEVFA
jgi:hypothetical protein